MTIPPRARRALPSAALALALSGAAAPAAAGGTLTYCTDAAPQGFDPAQSQTIATDNAAGLAIYDQLLSTRPGTTELAPGLAQRWEWSPDRRVLTLHLRPGVKFQSTPWFTPTRDMDAEDVLWSLQRMADPAHPGHAAATRGFPYWSGMNLGALVRSVAAPDPMTVRITLAHPDASFLATLAMPGVGSVLSAEYAGRLAKAGRLAQLDREPVGTGAFVLRSVQQDAVVRYAANPGWWAGAPAIAQLVFAVTPDTAVRAQRAKAGECLVAPVAAEQAAALESPALHVVKASTLNTWYVAPNTTRPFLSDPRLREALSLAVDRAALAKAAFGGLAAPAGSFLPPGSWAHDAALAIPHDPARAKALVRASGYDGRPLTLFAVAGDAGVQRAVALLQADWAAIGVKVVPQTMALGEFVRRAGRGEHDLAYANWFADDGDPDDFLAPVLSCAAAGHGTNKSQWCDPAFDALLAAARATDAVDARRAAYAKAQALLQASVPVIPLAHRVDAFAVSPRVAGVVVTPFGDCDFRHAALR